MKRSCAACGREFDAPSAQTKFCKGSSCVRARARARKHKQMTGTVVDLSERRQATEPGTVEQAVRDQLEPVGKLSTSTGQAALRLARRLDDNAEDAGSSVATIAKELRAHMAELLADVGASADEVDELKAKRLERLRGA